MSTHNDALGRLPSPLEEDYFAPGTPPSVARAVNYVADHESPSDGTAIAARLHARALHDAGIPTFLSSLSGSVVHKGARVPAALHIDDLVRAEVGHLRALSAAEHTARIIHMVVGTAEHLRKVMYPTSTGVATPEHRSLLAKRTVFFTVWERTSIPWDVAEVLGQACMNWVPCHQNAEALRARGIEDVHVVPHPYDPASPVLRLTERRPPEKPVFYFVGRWEPRKSPVELLEAYLTEFEPGEAKLRLKCSSTLCLGSYPEPAQAVERCLNLPEVQRKGWTRERLDEDVFLDVGLSKPEVILKQHFLGNVYCQVGHGEAWSLPAFDAKLAGNLLVHVPFGGTADYGTAEDIAVPYELEPAHSGYQWGDTCWAGTSVREISRGLRKAAERINAGRAFARPPGFERFSLSRVGNEMCNLLRLKEIAA